MRSEIEVQSGQEEDAQQTTVWIMRHAPTQWNIEKRIQGNVDTRLAPEATIAYFDAIKASTIPRPDTIIVSALGRTRETAERLIEHRGWSDTQILMREEFNERKWGILEGRTHKEVAEILAADPAILSEYPDILTRLDLSPILDAPEFKVDGAESMSEVTERVRPAFLSVRDEFPGKNLLFVSHAGVLISLGIDYHKITEYSLIKKDSEIYLRQNRDISAQVV